LTLRARRPNSREHGSPESDPAELERFYRLYFLPLVRRAVRRHGMSFEDAGDIVQDAFVVAVEKIDLRRNPRSWLYQVVDHLATNLRRKTLRRARLVARWEPPASIEHRSRLKTIDE